VDDTLGLWREVCAEWVQPFFGDIMKVGDLVKCKFTDYGIGIITMKRPFGGFIVCFPNSQIKDARKCTGLAEFAIEVISENR
jgi:hypothetical protein|tara:strand:+ start:277 stop:522 length:246 start_codon:yes stop_codon:yes gene_type:complete